MATRFSHTARIDTHVENVFTSYGDEAFWRDRIAAVGSPEDTLDDFSATGDTVTVTVTDEAGRQAATLTAFRSVG